MTATPAKNPVVAIDDRRSDGPANPAEPTDNKDLSRRMLDVQNLLFGDAQRLMEDRLDQTDDRHREAAEAFDERLRQLTETFERRMTALQEEVRTVNRDQTAQRRQALSSIGDAIKELAKNA